MCEDTPDPSVDPSGVRMSKLFRNSEAVLWAFSISQAVAMLAFNLLLRAAVS
jgi:hypothetical protein